MGGREAVMALVDGLRAQHAARRGEARAPAPAPAAAPRPRAFDFATLEQHREIVFQRAAAEVMGIASPFFRTAQDRAGATAIIDGAVKLNFASYDYLGLNGAPAVQAAAKAAIDAFGMSCSASRVVGGERPFHAELEAALAALYDAEDAVTMVSGHATNVTTIGALMGREDLIVCDELSHNSAMEGARLSGATRRSMPHNDLDWLERLLETERGRFRRVLIVVEGLYSMDGDMPELARLVEIKNAFDCWLMVDEAHAVGVLGARGRGVAEQQGVDPRNVEIWMGTLSKTLASTGGYIAGSAALIDVLKAKAPGFVFSVGLPPAMACAALAAVRTMLAEPERVTRLRAAGARLRDRLRAAGLDTGLSEGFAVAPVVLGASPLAAIAAHLALERGVWAPPILYPAVPERRARLRLFLNATHTDEQIDRAVEIIAGAVRDAPQIAGKLSRS